jgi:hypothetical protein
MYGSRAYTEGYGVGGLTGACRLRELHRVERRGGVDAYVISFWGVREKESASSRDLGEP